LACISWIVEEKPFVFGNRPEVFAVAEEFLRKAIELAGIARVRRNLGQQA
jgi:predicted membrane-bound dolichyl-phosphate-mannose-protein mannosyltransferase